MAEYITSKEAAEKWGITNRRVQILCKQGRIEGAKRHGWSWAIPIDSEKPIDKRVEEKIKNEIKINGNEVNDNA